MRVFSPAVKQLLEDGNIEFFYLIDLHFNNSYYLTSYSNDINYGGNVYNAESALFEIDSPKFSTVVDREAYKIILIDFNNELGAEFKANVVGKSVRVRIGLVDSNNNPMLNSQDIVDVYKGFVDSPQIIIDWETKLATIEGTSAMSDLDRVNTFITSKAGMDNVSSTDTSFDNIFSDSEVELKWGKK